jgi:hypothetical protein
MRTIKHIPYLIFHALQREYAGVIIPVGLSMLVLADNMPYRNDILAVFLAGSLVVVFLFLLEEVSLYQRTAADLAERIGDLLGVNPDSISGDTDEDRTNRYIASCLYKIGNNPAQFERVKEEVLLQVYNDVSMNDRENVSEMSMQITLAMLIALIIMQLYTVVMK